ncbi:MAG: hypothetical protein HKM93_05040 [Desulfobacteraceae bacterium]|nr:hypothetical protein [Desulfobacteraceae bacterium]
MFEDLIPIFIFLIFILPSLIKKIRSTKKPPTSKPVKAKKPSALSEMFRQLKEQIEKAVEVQPGTPTTMEAPVSSHEPEALEEEIYLLEEDILKPVPVKPVTTRPGIRDTEVVAEKRSPKWNGGAFTLKKAVVWREILGPPLALRDREEDFKLY